MAQYRRHVSKAILLLAIVSFVSCKDKKEFNQETAQSTVDVRSAVGEMDEVIKDVNTVIMEQYLLRGRSSRTTTTSVCGVTIDTTGELKGACRMIYNGSECYGRIRNGVVSFTIEGYPLQKWKQKGCKLHISFQNYMATRTSDGRFVRLIGDQELSNESGNSWFELWYMGAQQAVYRHTGTDLRVEYSGDASSEISVDRRLTFTYASQNITCRVDGMSNQNNRTHAEAWGIVTSNEHFVADVMSTYVWTTRCGAVAPTSGQEYVVLDGKDYELRCDYGVDEGGSHVTDSSKCPFGWEVTWKRKKRTNARLFGYF